MFLSILLALALTVAASAHTVTVRCVFYCDRNPKLPVFVELMEQDLFIDDRLQWSPARISEPFEIKGTEDEYRGIRPYLRVMHSCRGFDETVIIKLGKRRGEEVIDLGDVDLEDPNVGANQSARFVRN